MPRGKAICSELCQLVIKKHQSGASQRGISKDLYLPRQTVQTIIKRYKEKGTIKPGKAKGADRLLSKSDLRLFRRQILKDRHTSIAELTLWARNHFKITISERTVRRYIRRCGFGIYKAKIKPLITQKNKRARVKWAKERKTWTTCDWKKILWSDESLFHVLHGNIGKSVIRTKLEKSHPGLYLRKVQKPPSFMIWGCMAANGVGELHFCKGTVNKESYIGILEKNLMASKRHLFKNRTFTFQQDNAPAHKAKLTKNWLQQKRVKVLPWPATSPDLNPIENLWRILKRRVAQFRPKTIEQLRTLLLREWQNIKPELTEKLVLSMPKRLESVIKLKGDITKW